ncbi:MAG TPA: hypothetical protein PKI78_02100 [Anaerolineales bacterium]|nr:hypothetical protein [Anaerolineales bacterium]
MSEAKKTLKKQSEISLDIHIDAKFLQDHLKDVRAEMSWRRELEFRLLQLLLVFYPIIGTVMVQLFNSDVDAFAFRFTAIILAFLILAVSYFVVSRISHEHKAYAKLGKQVQMIWKYYGLFESGAYIPDKSFLSKDLLDEKEGYGQGQGYRKTQILIGALTFVMLTILIALAMLKV